MDRFQALDVTNSSLGAHLYPSEEVLLLTPGVGMYSGSTKSLPHASGTVYLTSHRLFYIDDTQPHKHSCTIKLALIRETQFYGGFLKSSPKITLGLRPREESQAAHSKNSSDYANGRNSQEEPAKAGQANDWRLGATAADASSSTLPTSSWVCRVCAFSNALDPGIDRGGSVRCALCGVSTDVKDLTLQANKPSRNMPTMMPAAAISKNASTSHPSNASDGIACPTCTFHNHPSMLRCEMCDSPLGTADAIGEGGGASSARPSSSQRAGTPSTPQLSRRTPEPEERQELHDHVRLSFRKGGDRTFYDTLKTTLKEKRWQRGDGKTSGPVSKAANGAAERDGGSGRATPIRRRFVGGGRANIDGRSAAAHSDEELRDASTPSRRVGIEGIMSAVDLQSREESSDMQDALRDLEALMTRAKKMVDFAEALNNKLTKQQESATATSGVSGAADDEAATMIRSSLVRLGLPTPAITSDMARDQQEFYVQLARELAGLLYAARRPLLGRGKVLVTPLPASTTASVPSMVSDDSPRDGSGLLPLDEVWCLWNRARGVALVSPKELLAVVPFLSRLTVPPIACRTFASGVKVLHTPRFAERTLSARICAVLQTRQAETDATGLDGAKHMYAAATTLELARLEACPLHLMDELLGDIELNQGVIARDERGGQVTWYLNRFTPLL